MPSQLRSSEPRVLWVDAICINQSNPDEKNHQVRQMYRIYSSASRVLIWLGNADRDNRYALQNLEGSGRGTIQESYDGLDMKRIG